MKKEIQPRHIPVGKGEHLYWQKQWAFLIDNAMLFYGTSLFYQEVMRIKDALVDIKPKALIKTEVEQYYNTIWIPLCWIKFKQLANPNTMIHWQNIYLKRIQNEEAIKLLNKIRKTIQDNGYGLRISGGKMGGGGTAFEEELGIEYE